MSNFYELLYSTNQSVVPTQDVGLVLDGLVQQELDFSGQSGDGTVKPSHNSECRAKDPVHCPHHGTAAASKVDGLAPSSPKKDNKMTKEEYEKALKVCLARASEEQLRVFLKKIDDGKHELSMRLFNEEVKRRSIRHNETSGHGEWI